MTRYEINIDLPPDLLVTLNESELELNRRIKFALTLQLYLQQKVTIGKAAQLAEISRYEFETYLSKQKIPNSLLELEEVLRDFEKLK